MNEIITVSGVNYSATNVVTGTNTISFTLSELVADEADAIFRNAKSLTVGDETNAVYGEYPDVEFQSLTIGADEDVTVTMHILTETEKQIRDLQTSQAEQDEAIAVMMFGGEE